MGKERNTRTGIGDALRDRGKKPESDISDVWLSHKIDDRKQKKSDRKKKLQFDARVNKLKKQLSTTVKKVQVAKNKTKTKAKAKATRSRSQTPKKTFRPSKVRQASGTKSLNSFRSKKGALVVAVLAAAVIFWPSGSSDQPQQLGASDNTSEQQSQGASNSDAEVNTVISTEFDLLWPGDKGPEDYEVARVSPPSNDPVYA